MTEPCLKVGDCFRRLPYWQRRRTCVYVTVPFLLLLSSLALEQAIHQRRLVGVRCYSDGFHRGDDWGLNLRRRNQRVGYELFFGSRFLRLISEVSKVENREFYGRRRMFLLVLDVWSGSVQIRDTNEKQNVLWFIAWWGRSYAPSWSASYQI